MLLVQQQEYRVVWWQEWHPACKNWVVRYWHGYLSIEQGANDLHMVQLMPLPSHHLLLQ